MPRKKPEASPKGQCRKRKSIGVTENDAPAVSTTGKPRLKLRLQLGNSSVGEKKFPVIKPEEAVSTKEETEDLDVELEDLDPLTIDEDCDALATTQDDDEEAWLDALEKGDLDDYGELKKEKDPSLMTARQRAIKERTSVLSSKSFANVALLGATKVTMVVTEEAQKRKEEKNKRRKLQAVKKAEESQKQTIERLIKQQGSKMSKERQKKSGIATENGSASQQPKPDAKVVKKMKFVSKGSSLTLSFPADTEFPVKIARPIPQISSCGVCGNKKKYSCSKTSVPLCSLSCYRTNLAQTVT